MPMNTHMNMTQISTVMNMIIPTNMNMGMGMGMPIRMRMPRATMSIKTTMARTIMAIRIMTLKRISTSTNDERRNIS